MDEQIARKEMIFREISRKKSEGVLSQSDTVDLKQELEKCNHIMNHIIRGYVNPAGKWAAIAVFGGAGFCYWLSTISNKSRVISIRSSLMLVPYVVLPCILAVHFAKRRLGDRKEAKRFSQMRDDSMDIDEKFYDLVDNLERKDLKY